MAQLQINHPTNYIHSDLTGIIIRAFYKVYNTLGYGFLEKVYERSLILELSNYKLNIKSQYPIAVHYLGSVVGNYYSDLVVEDLVIVEIKAVETINPYHESQLVNYLKATDKEVGLLLNFGTTPVFKRKVLLNENK